MKRIISLLITLVLLLSFTACQKNEVDNEIATLDEFTEAEPFEKTETENSEQEEILKDNTQAPAEQLSDKSQVDVPSEINPDTPASSDEVSDKEDTTELSNPEQYTEIQSDKADTIEISDPKPYTEIQLDSLSNYISYETIEMFEEIRNMTQVIIFLGKKVDIESKQAVKYNSFGAIYDCYTDTTVEVITPYYGNIKSGDIIEFREFCAVVEWNGKNVLKGDDKPTGDKEHLFVLWRGNISTKLLSGDYPIYYPISPAHPPLEKAVYDTKCDGSTFNQMIYKKYVIDGDTALDEEKELKKALDWKKEYESRLANAGESKMSKEEIEKMTLTDEESAKIKELVKRYNNMSKR